MLRRLPGATAVEAHLQVRADGREAQPAAGRRWRRQVHAGRLVIIANHPWAGRLDLERSRRRDLEVAPVPGVGQKAQGNRVVAELVRAVRVVADLEYGLIPAQWVREVVVDPPDAGAQ